MLSKFILVSETHFQNTETALKNQQALIQGLETQIGQLSELISERPQGNLPSNTEPNPREHLNAISTQDNEGFITPEPEIQQNNAMNKGREEVNNNDPKQEPTRTKTTEAVHYYQELDEWQEHKLRTYDKLKLHKNKPDTSPNQLKVGDTVLLDAVDPHIVTTTPNEEIPLTALSIFPFGVSIETRPITQACLRLCENRTKDFPNTGYDKTPRPCDMAVVEPAHAHVEHPWLNLSNIHGCGVEHMGVGEANEARHGCATRPWEPTCPMHTGAFNVVFRRKENRHTSLEEKEWSVILRWSNRKNSSPFPTVSMRAPRRALPNTSGPTFSGPLHRLGCYRTSPDG
ncbi:hypothetical protein GOBAR_AA08655 [Gossypium barbadense]|uniref:Uncharacterized protein n=1 Tax=Gossypium barbadense TaxID=3634 RepID=A0A2P5Y8S2_GOSBA|nr:hypothetical protein GOBAR_AA08655 [Gossypium barbadense]